MLWSLDHYRKYPFAAVPSDFPHLFVENPLVAVASSSHLAEKLIEVLSTIVKKSRVDFSVFRDYEESVLLYHALLELVKLLGDKRISNRLSLAFAKSAASFFENEDEEVLLMLGVKIGLRVSYERFPPKIPRIVKLGDKEVLEFRPLKFILPVEEYVKIVAKRLMHDASYSLTNTIVSNGHVYLDKQTYQRVLEEYIYYYVLQLTENTPQVQSDKVNAILNTVKEKVLEEYYRTVEKPEYTETTTAVEPPTETEEKVVESLFPPCIRRIIDTINTGSNPSHLERFTLAAFLGQVGLTVDEILEYFRKTADYNEKIARYQIEHILGMRGSRKRYMPYGCSNLKASGLCPISDQCPGGRNPVTVYKYAVRKLKKKQVSTENIKLSNEEVADQSKAAGGI